MNGSQSAKVAMKIRAMRKARANISPSDGRLNFLRLGAEGLAGTALVSVGVAMAVVIGALLGECSGVADTRVDDRVGQVDEEVHDDDARDQDRRGALDREQVLAEQGDDEHVAHPVEIEERLDDDRGADHPAELRSDAE